MKINGNKPFVKLRDMTVEIYLLKSKARMKNVPCWRKNKKYYEYCFAVSGDIVLKGEGITKEKV